MATVENPSLAAFIGQVGDGLVVAQVLIRPAGAGYELRHVEDRDGVENELRSLNLAELRDWVQFTEDGAFRPLKSAPNLRGGWRARVSDAAGFGELFEVIYPGAVADWHAAQSGTPPVTHFREYTARQTGMYRVAAMLGDEQAETVVKACCGPSFCLKRRLWTVGGLSPDSAGEKSVIPCLEMCALMLEFSRKAMRIEQEDRFSVMLAPDEVATMRAALDRVLETPDTSVREGDFNAPLNPRRVQLLKDRLRVAKQGVDHEKPDPAG